MPHVLTAPTPPPAGSSTPLRSVAAGTRNETSLKRLGPARRATVAQSLRSLRPHHSRTAPRHSFRPRWLRCARVSQRTITSGADAPNGATQDREIVMNTIEQIETHEHSATAAACEHAALYGATPERDEFDNIWDADDAIDAVQNPSASSLRASARTASARRRTREPALGFRQHARQPRPSVSTGPPTS